MRRIDNVILREIIGPWLFGVGMFAVVIFAGNFLFQFSQLLVQGAAPLKVLQLTLLVLPGVVVKTFPMAILLAALLAFGRLSSDSEIVAMRAAGVSIRRMMYPVAGFALFVAIISFFLNDTIVPGATMKGLAMQNDLATELKTSGDQPLAFAVKNNKGEQTALVAASDFNLGSRSLLNVTITVYGSRGKPSFYLHAPMFKYTDDKNWHIFGGADIISFDGSQRVVLNGETWPPDVPTFNQTPEDLLKQSLKNLDAYTLAQMRKQIEDAKHDPHVSRKQIANLEYGFWNKFALPLAALVYGLLGAPLGIRNVRTGAATGFAVSIAIIFGYITLANLMNVYAMGGAIPAYLASFTPLVIGLIAAGVIIWRRNG